MIQDTNNSLWRWLEHLMTMVGPRVIASIMLMRREF
jgi:hypothetical protein